MNQQQPRYGDLLLLIFVLLAAVGMGETYLYKELVARKAALKPPAPVKAEPAPTTEVATTAPPVETPKPAEPAKPQPYPLKVVSRRQAGGKGGPLTYVVQGTNRNAMAGEIALDAFMAAFYDVELVDPLGKASRATKKKWAGWVQDAIRATDVKTDERGMVVTFEADIAVIRKSLQVQGISFSPVVPSFEIETNGSYAPNEMVIQSLAQGLGQQSAYWVGAAMFASPSVVEKQVNGLRLKLDGEPYGIHVTKQKDFGESVVGRSILYYVNVVPQ